MYNKKRGSDKLEYDPSDEEHLQIMEYLVSEGAAILEGLDEDGEPVYKFDMDILEEVMPDLYQVMIDDLDQELIELYKNGLIEISYDEELNANMTVSEQGKIALSELGYDFNDSEED